MRLGGWKHFCTEVLESLLKWNLYALKVLTVGPGSSYGRETSRRPPRQRIILLLVRPTASVFLGCSCLGLVVLGFPSDWWEGFLFMELEDQEPGGEQVIEECHLGRADVGEQTLWNWRWLCDEENNFLYKCLIVLDGSIYGVGIPVVLSWCSYFFPLIQQRVFAMQVFELHKLIKVQRLIAESPHLLLEHGTFLGKSSLKSSLAKKLALEFVVKPFPYVANSKDCCEKPNEKMECSEENAVGKTSLLSAKTGSQSLNYLPHAGNPRPVVTRSDNKMGPWCFHRSPVPQWLVPVMSPSEGLVYKPYTSPGLSGTVYGEHGTSGSTALPGNFPNPDFGITTSHHHQGIGVFPGTSPVSHTYFPPYIIPAMNLSMSGSAVEQVNQFVVTGPVLGGVVDLNTGQQSSGNVSAQDNGSASQPRKSQASETKGSDLQGGTASTPGERAKEVGISHNAKGRDPLPIAPVVSEEASQSRKATTPTPPRVIKVVPHNPRSATESAARIFRFIQEERKQYNPI